MSKKEPHPIEAFDKLRKAFPDKKRDAKSVVVYQEEDMIDAFSDFGLNVYTGSLFDYVDHPGFVISNEELTEEEVDKLLGYDSDDRADIIAKAKKRWGKHYSGPEK